MNGARPTDPGDGAASGSRGWRADYRWSITSLALAHKRVTAASLVIVLALVAVTIVTTVSNPSRQPLGNSATCSQWASGTPAQKMGYSHLYINEYGRVPNTVRYARAVETAINKACTEASYLGEADDLSVLAGIRHAF